MRRALVLLALLLAAGGCNQLLGISEPTLGLRAPDAPSASGPDAALPGVPDAPAAEPDAPAAEPDAPAAEPDAPTPDAAPGAPDAPPTLVVSITKQGTGQGHVLSSPGGIDCADDCTTQTATFPAGTSVTLTLAPNPGSYFAGWTDCLPNGLSCTVGGMGPHDVTVKVQRIVNNVVFATSTTFPGALGGLGGADDKCAHVAGTAGLPGKFVAFLSATGTTARSRLKLPNGSGEPRGFVRVDGRPVADTVADLVDVRHIFYPPDLDERGDPIQRNLIWTGATASGGVATETCAEWTGGAGTFGAAGLARASANWVSGGRSGCETGNAIYCIQVDLTQPLELPAPATGKLVYLSRGVFKPGPGPGAADAVCAAEKPASVAVAGALLATSTRSGASLVSGKYVRPDGVPIDFATFGTQAARAGIWVYADGGYAPAVDLPFWVWAGSLSFTGVPTAGNACTDWSSEANQGVPALAADGVSGWGQARSMNCNVPLPLYCVEK